MSAKFIKQNDKWLVAVVTDSSGIRATAIGDIVSVKLSSGGKSRVVITGIVETSGVPETYGYRTVATFVNH